MLHKSLQFSYLHIQKVLKQRKPACLFLCISVCMFECLIVCLFAWKALHLIYVLNLLEHQTNVVAIHCTILSQNACGLVTWVQWKHRTIWYSHTYHICKYHIWKKQIICATYFSNLENICNRQKNFKFSTIRFFLQNINIHVTLHPTIKFTTLQGGPLRSL